VNRRQIDFLTKHSLFVNIFGRRDGSVPSVAPDIPMTGKSKVSDFQSMELRMMTIKEEA
jgi:hypothetical protein